jgi:hypothetical protein
MSTMAGEEIMEFIKSWAWGTLIGVEGNREDGHVSSRQ